MRPSMAILILVCWLQRPTSWPVGNWRQHSCRVVNYSNLILVNAVYPPLTAKKNQLSRAPNTSLENISTDGSLRSYKVATAILYYRNIPLLVCNLIPAQILFYHLLCDNPHSAITQHPNPRWLLPNSEGISFTNATTLSFSNSKCNTKELILLQIGMHEVIQ